jgi:hypothetical protein
VTLDSDIEIEKPGPTLALMLPETARAPARGLSSAAVASPSTNTARPRMAALIDPHYVRIGEPDFSHGGTSDAAPNVSA